jgi:hypothetical protein
MALGEIGIGRVRRTHLRLGWTEERELVVHGPVTLAQA